jgi:hypothetical protein
MAEIITFKRSIIRNENTPRSGNICDIVFFPGVRYEKRDEAITVSTTLDASMVLPAVPVAT